MSDLKKIIYLFVLWFPQMKNECVNNYNTFHAGMLSRLNEIIHANL